MRTGNGCEICWRRSVFVGAKEMYTLEGKKRKNTRTPPFPSPGFSLLFQVKSGKQTPKKGVLLVQAPCWTNAHIESKEGTIWVYCSHLLMFVFPDQRKTHWCIRLEKSAFFSSSLYHRLFLKVYWERQDRERRLIFLSQNAFDQETNGEW